jgi:hypothetical protein
MGEYEYRIREKRENMAHTPANSFGVCMLALEDQRQLEEFLLHDLSAKSRSVFWPYPYDSPTFRFVHCSCS